MPAPRLLIATTNPGKLREARAVLAELCVHLFTLTDGPPVAQPVEDAETFEENAVIKALHYARLTGCWALADDSGLEVDALDGRPGVFSARYAGEGCSPAENNVKLVAELAAVEADRRTARFRCAIALATPRGIVATAAGAVDGMIVDRARGANGFGYDPHFLVPSLGKTMAELSPEQKNGISHRGQALRAILPAIERLLSDPPDVEDARTGL